MRKIFISDIHSNFTKMCALLENVKYSQHDDVLIIGGDYFDRGKEAEKVAKWLEQVHTHKNVVLIKGNHDIWLEYLLEDTDFSDVAKYNEVDNMISNTNNGGLGTIEQLCNREDVRNLSYYEIRDIINQRFPMLKSVMKSMKWYHETDSEIFTHATLPNNFKDANFSEWFNAVWGDTERFALRYPIDKKPVYVGHLSLVNFKSWDKANPIKIRNVTLCDGSMAWGNDGIVIELK